MSVLPGSCARGAQSPRTAPQVCFLCLSRRLTPQEVEEAPMTSFFIPGLGKNGCSEEDVYAEFRRAARVTTGHEPREERIFKLSCRRGGHDCEAEVGKPDPVGGETVLAILDLGRLGPYVIGCGSPHGRIDQIIVEK